MKRIITFFLSLVFCFWGYSQSLTPEVTASAGDDFTGTNVQLSWTLGEIMVETYVNGTVELTQGFHQTNLIVTAVDDLQKNLKVNVFPNPTTDELHIECAKQTETLTLTLYDLTGKQLLKEEAFQQEVQHKTIDLLSFPAGTYFLKLSSSDQKQTTTFKIIKNN